MHRDVKPDNILLREDRTAVLTDFGIAQAAKSETKRRPQDQKITEQIMHFSHVKPWRFPTIQESHKFLYKKAFNLDIKQMIDLIFIEKS